MAKTASARLLSLGPRQADAGMDDLLARGWTTSRAGSFRSAERLGEARGGAQSIFDIFAVTGARQPIQNDRSTGWKETLIRISWRSCVRLTVVLLAVLAAFSVFACSKKQLAGVAGVAIPNLPPTVELSQAPATADTAGTYVYELSWAGFDPDGRVVRFFYAIDPPSKAFTDTLWVGTTANRGTFTFRSDSVGSGGSTRARGFHTVALYCVDDRGARSPVVFASFTSTTVAPTVQILSPTPSALISRELASAVHVEWSGIDPDGVGTLLPASYRWKLFGGSGDIPVAAILADPDSLRRQFAPTFASWDSLPGTAHGVEVRNLVPGQNYIFAIVAIDQAGAYSPVFTASSNLLAFHVNAAASLGPIITISSPTFTFTYPSGGFFIDPASFIHAEFAADRPVQFVWSAKAAAGSFVRNYRWAVDIASIDDESLRKNEDTDFAHWSRQSTTTSLVLPAYSPAGGRRSETHLFYLEANDDLGFTSLAVVQFTVVRPTFDHELLIVDDTWFTPDHAAVGGCVQGASGTWPSAAELDTFLYAAGDMPYRCYPAGTRSPVGVLAGYSFDTLCTHLTPATALNLQLLDRYRNIVWMVDVNSALLYNDDPQVSVRPMPQMHAWNTPGTSNPLATWLQQGGRLWLTGGGAALASLRAYDAPKSPNNVFSSVLGELSQGRMMFDSAHWRSEITVLKSARAVRTARAVGGWPGAPDYTQLPAELDEKTPDTDPLPPLRTGGVYLTQYPAEHLTRSNAIVELDNPDPTIGRAFAALDTIYETSGGDAGSGWPVMTLYHGSENGTFVFSGFPPWYFQRTQLIQLVDFVLQRVWGLTRKPVVR